MGDNGLGLVLFGLGFLALKYWYILVPVLVGTGVALGYAIFG